MVTLTTKDKDYELKLNIKGVYRFEKLSGKSVYDLVMGIDAGRLPTVTDMATLITVSMDKRDNPSYDVNKGIDLLSDYCEDNGKMPLDLIATCILPLLKEAGILRDTTEEDDAE